MKTTTFLILISFSIALMSCKKDDDSNPTTPVNSAKEVPGKWKVSYYFDGTDETSDYTSYAFEFTADGNLNAATSSQTYQGSWYQTVDDNLPRLVIMLSGNEDLLELSDDWVIESISSSEIHLRDDNTSSMEELKFTKIN